MVLLIENIVDLERLLWPTLSLVISFVVWVCILVSMTTPGWITLNLFRGVNSTAPATIASGNITIGLIRTTERIETGFGVQGDTFYTYQKYGDHIDIVPVGVVIGCCAFALALCSLLMVFEFANTYRIVRNVWIGPSTIYLFALATASLLIAACAGFSEFYLYMDSSAILNISRHETLTFNHYKVEQEVFYSPIILMIGTILSLLPILFSWRLTVLLPSFYKKEAILDKIGATIPEPPTKFTMMPVFIDPTDGDLLAEEEDEGNSGTGSDPEADSFEGEEGDIPEEYLNDMLADYHNRKD